jgi:hypothetical protein
MDFFSDEEGSSLVLFMFLLVVIIGIAGLVVDFGLVYKAKSHLNKTVNAAVLSGAQELTNSREAAYEVVETVLEAHGEKNTLSNIQIENSSNYKLRVSLEKEVSMYFLRLFRLSSINIKAAAAAELAPMARATGVVPLGIDKRITIEFMKEYSLKVDSGDSAYGNFGILALSGTGARLYENDLRYGYEGEIKAGDIISTQTGNIAGKTRDAVNSRINSCPYPSIDIDHRDCSRVILVVIYEPYSIQSNQLKEVKVSGFAYFYIKNPMGNSDSSITGYFIKRVGNGFSDGETADSGAYVIRLTE